MIAEFPDDQAPSIARHSGKIAVYIPDPDGADDNHGFLLSAAAATDTAVKMLSAVEDLAGDDAFGFDVEGFTGKIVRRRGADPEARITLSFRGSRFTAALTATQLAELAAGLGLGARLIDTPAGPPRPDTA